MSAAAPSEPMATVAAVIATYVSRHTQVYRYWLENEPAALCNGGRSAGTRSPASQGVRNSEDKTIRAAAHSCQQFSISPPLRDFLAPSLVLESVPSDSKG